MPAIAAATAAAVVGGYFITVRALTAVAPEERAEPLSVFDLREFEPMEPDEPLLLETRQADEHLSTDDRVGDELLTDEHAPDELLLAECDKLPDNPFERAERLLLEHYKAAPSPDHEMAPDEEPLLLDDILAELKPDSRVVRLFDPEAMPTPAELKSRIDSHLQPGIARDQSPDAGQALHDALADLRRSIR